MISTLEDLKKTIIEFKKKKQLSMNKMMKNKGRSYESITHKESFLHKSIEFYWRYSDSEEEVPH